MIDLTILKERVKSDVFFVYAQGGDLYYTSGYDDYLFVIPYQDTLDSGGSHPKFQSIERGIILMRWIKKQMELEQSLIEDWGRTPSEGLEGEAHTQWLERLGKDPDE